ncbi:protein of unknown function [Candidatus Nitrotoga arctica]|uniref:Uncharacterized protein n=1 Tax=Candidatus Nitrotoga arctica TaxID=453162 RepID=A0ABN8AHV7_9PROT|nr:protein of unknown function [Candidatus Nitrotoga arctica]
MRDWRSLFYFYFSQVFDGILRGSVTFEARLLGAGQLGNWTSYGSKKCNDFVGFAM